MRQGWKVVVALAVSALVVAGLVFAYLQMRQERKAEAEREKPVAAKSRVSPSTNGEPILTLDEEAQTRIGLQAEPLKPAKLTLEVKGYGRILDPAPLLTLVTELALGQAERSASQKEFERLKLLNEQKNASDRALQTAEAAARRDQIAVESARTRLVSGWGTAIAERPDLASFVQSLATLERSLVRIDLPAGETLKGIPTGARIVGVSAEANPVTARFLGLAPNVDPQMQGQAFLFLVKGSSPNLVPGRAVSGYLQLEGETLSGCILPDSAVVRHADHGWVYVQTGRDTFTRRKIALDHRTDGGWFVSAGVAADDRVVVHGAQALLSEEQKDWIKMLD
jgi:multidrug efflux system membrane fusion protein